MEFKIVGDDKVFDRIQKQLKAAPKSALKKIGQAVYSQIRLHYKNAEDPSGQAWRPLKPSTVRQKVRKSGKVVPLVDTGNLRNSLNYRVDGDKLRIGYSARYSVFHQLGTKFMPKRKILPTDVDELDMEEIKEVLLDEVVSNR